MAVLWTVVLLVVAGAAVWALRYARARNAQIWLPSSVRGDWAGRRERATRRRRRPVHVMFCVADHFEPAWGRPDLDVERRRVEHWVSAYPEIADRFRDSDGQPPRHTFFYPAEEYRPEHLESLAQLVRGGYGEVEVHLHHDDDTSDGLSDKLNTFTAQLQSHGLLGSRRADGRRAFAFVHGNWSLDNSRPDGRWCGVNDELRVLSECGCYADFTLPSAPSPTQTRRINSIYYAEDDPDHPKSHDDGTEVSVGGEPCGDLLLVQGPLRLHWPGGRFGLLPYIENGDCGACLPPSARRVRAWVETGICVAGRPEWVFVKVHTHGCQERSWPALFGEPARRMHRCLTEEFNDDDDFVLHYVTAREVCNIVKAAERGLEGDPERFRDLVIERPAAAEAEEPVTTERERVE